MRFEAVADSLLRFHCSARYREEEMKKHSDGSQCVVVELPCPHPECFSGGEHLSVPRLPEPLVNYRGKDVKPITAPCVEVETYKRCRPSADMPFWHWVGIEQG